MFRFVSSIKPFVLKKSYLKQYNVKLLQAKFDVLMTAYPEIKAVLPDDISAKKLLVGNFKYLTKVYCAFTSYLNGKSTKDRLSIKNAFVRGGFNYDSHKTKISNFLMDITNQFEIHNCIYCDIEDVTTFTKANGTKVRTFETEHVLDKGDCPLVGMSLYNFVPSCRICNGPDIKGTKTIGDTETEIARLSPTAEGYDFSNKVKFAVKMLTPGVEDLKATSCLDDYEIDFNISLVIDHMRRDSKSALTQIGLIHLHEWYERLGDKYLWRRNVMKDHLQISCQHRSMIVKFFSHI